MRLSGKSPGSSKALGIPQEDFEAALAPGFDTLDLKEAKALLDDLASTTLTPMPQDDLRPSG
jgi:hypothetical protein